MPDVSIRLAEARDVEILAELNAEVQGLHVANRPDQFKLTELAQVTEWYRQTLQNPAAKIWMAEVDGSVQGYLLALVRERDEGPFCPARTWWELDQIAVRAASRRQGIARALVEKALAEARVVGIREVELNSWSFNQAAQQAFARFGFVPKVVRFELLLAES